MFLHSIKNLRLGEFDLGGVLYHANYYHLYEAAREALLAENGLPYSSLVEEGNHLAIAEAHQHFKSPIFYGEELEVELRFDPPSRTSVKAHYTIYAHRSFARSRQALAAEGPETTKQLVHTGWTLLAYVTAHEGRLRSSRLPENLLKIILKYPVIEPA